MLSIGTRVLCVMKEDRAPKYEGEIVLMDLIKGHETPYYVVEFGNRQVVFLEDQIEEVLPIPQKSDPSKSTVRIPTPKGIENAKK